MDNRSLPPRVLIPRADNRDKEVRPYSELTSGKNLLDSAAESEYANRITIPERRAYVNVPKPLEFADRRRNRATSGELTPREIENSDNGTDSSNQFLKSQTDYGRLQELMDDPEVEEIWLNSPNRIFFAKSGISQLSNVVMNAEEVRSLIERLLMWGGRRLDLSNPFVDARLPDGSRLHVAIPEITAKHWAVNIRKHLVRGSSLEDLTDMGVMSAEVEEFLQACVSAGKNILVSGSTQAGKTTLLNALISAAPTTSRIITIEEVFELRPKLPDCVALQTRPPNLQGEGEIPLRRLIKEALRMRPSRLVVGEIREAESLDLLIALNSGLPGAATIHANSAQDAITKLQTLPLLAGENISHRFITPVVASAIDLVVHISLDLDGRRMVKEVLALTGRVEGDRIETEPVFTLRSREENKIPKYIRGIGQVAGIAPVTQTAGAHGADLDRSGTLLTGVKSSGSNTPVLSNSASSRRNPKISNGVIA